MRLGRSQAQACPSSEVVATFAQRFPFAAYAQELKRLANVVEEHSRIGRVSLQTLSQLVAMEEIIELIRSTGIAVLVSSQDGIHESESTLENRVGYI